MQFGVLAQVLFLGGPVGKLLGGMQFGVLVHVLVTVCAHFCKIECWVLGGMQFSVLQVLFWGPDDGSVFVRLTQVLGGTQFGVLVQVLGVLSGALLEVLGAFLQD